MDWSGISGVVAPVDEAQIEVEVSLHVAGMDRLKDPWRIASIGQADWAMRRVAEARAIIQQYDDEIALWREARRRIESAGDWYEERLKEWAVEQRTETRKSFPMAHGTISTKKIAPKVEVVDEDAAIGWARRSCVLAIKTTESFQVSKATVRVVPLVSEYELVDKATGLVEHRQVEPRPFDQADVDALQAEVGDGYVVAVSNAPLGVVDEAGRPVPGLAVRPGRITATVGAVMA